MTHVQAAATPPLVERMESRQMMSTTVVVTNQGPARDSFGDTTSGWTGFLISLKADAGKLISAVDMGETNSSANGIFGALLQNWATAKGGVPSPVGASATDTNGAGNGTDTHVLVINRVQISPPFEDNNKVNPPGAPPNTASDLWGTGTYLRGVFGMPAANQLNNQPLAYVVLKNGTTGRYAFDVASRSPGQASQSLSIAGTFGTTAVSPGSMAGNLFNDLSGDGVRQSGEGNLSGRTFYLDGNTNGRLDTGEVKTTTDGNGNYKFSNLAANKTYRVRELLPAGWRVSFPNPNWFYDVPIASGQNVTGKNFADTQRVRIAGTVFNDANGNKVKDGSEGGLAGWRVYIDLNNNSKFDTGEASKITDAAGNYVFLGLKAATWRVRVAPPAGVTGFTTTTPVGGLFTLTLGPGQIANDRLFGERKIA